jgi:hypothetical protein
MEETRNVYISLVGKPPGMYPLRKLRNRWEDNIKADLEDR